VDRDIRLRKIGPMPGGYSSTRAERKPGSADAGRGRSTTAKRPAPDHGDRAAVWKGIDGVQTGDGGHVVRRRMVVKVIQKNPRGESSRLNAACRPQGGEKGFAFLVIPVCLMQDGVISPRYTT